MGMFDEIKDKVTQAAADNPDQVEQLSDQGIEKAGDAVDGATGGKFSGQIDSAQQAADERIGE